MGLVDLISRRHSVVLFSRRKNQRAWIALISSSEFGTGFLGGVKSANVVRRNMQDCFRAHPDIYGAELEDDEEEYQGEGESKAPVAAPSEEASPLPTPVAQSEHTQAAAATREEPAPAAKREDSSPSSKTEKAKAATEQVQKDHTPTSESEHLVPRAAHDAR